jgi:hypothetical protein
MARTASRLLAPLALTAALAMMSLAAADDLYREADGLAVYLGLLPAEMVRGQPPRHLEERMHGGPPRGEHAYHLTVAVFDAGTGARIEDAKVEAEVARIGLRGPRRTLEPMALADTITYGGYVTFGGRGLFRIRLWITTPDRPEPVGISFDHRHTPG